MEHALHVYMELNGFGFFCTEESYEISPILSTFHLTKAGAYKAMRMWKLSCWDSEFNRWTRKERRKEMRGSMKFCQHHEWGITPMTYRIYN